MSSATLNLPFAPDADRAGTVRSFLLASAVHCVLFGFLYFGIRWQSQPPDMIAAELWTPVQTVPAPVPAPSPPVVETRPEPKPEVRDEARPLPKPEITEKIEKKKPESAPKAEPKPRVQEDPIKEALRKEELTRALQNETTAQAAAREAATQADRNRKGWEAQIAAKVRSRVRLPDNLAGNPEAVFEVSLLPNMEILSVKLVKTSGNTAYDEAAERAINASSPLPPPPAGVDPGRVLRFPFRPKN